MDKGFGKVGLVDVSTEKMAFQIALLADGRGGFKRYGKSRRTEGRDVFLWDTRHPLTNG